MEREPLEEARPILSVDFGPVLHARILDVSKMLDIPKSELVRAAVSFFLDGEYYNKLDSKEKKKQVRLSKKEEVYRIVQEYNTIFYGNTSPPSQFYPALYKVYNNAIKGGLTYLDLIDLIKVSPNETFVAEMLRSGKTPSLPYLLSNGMIPRLMVTVKDREVKEEKLSESDLVEFKYDVIDQNIGNVDYNLRDQFVQDVEGCTDKTSIRRVLREYIR